MSEGAKHLRAGQINQAHASFQQALRIKRNAMIVPQPVNFASLKTHIADIFASHDHWQQAAAYYAEAYRAERSFHGYGSDVTQSAADRLIASAGHLDKDEYLPTINEILRAEQHRVERLKKEENRNELAINHSLARIARIQAVLE